MTETVNDEETFNVTLTTPSPAQGEISYYSYPHDPQPAGQRVAINWKIKNVGGTAGSFNVKLIDVDTGTRLAYVGMGSIAAGAISSLVGQSNLTMPNHDWHLRIEVWKA